MKKSRFNLLALSLISRFGRSACQKGDSESKPSFSDYPEVSEFKPSEKPTEKPTENPTEKPSSGNAAGTISKGNRSTKRERDKEKENPYANNR